MVQEWSAGTSVSNIRTLDNPRVCTKFCQAKRQIISVTGLRTFMTETELLQFSDMVMYCVSDIISQFVLCSCV